MDANLQILLTVAQQSVQQLTGLKTQVDGLAESLKKVGESNTHKVGDDLKDVGDHAKGANGGIMELVEGMKHLKEVVEGVVGGFLALEAVKFFMEMGKEAIASEAVARNLQLIGNAAGYSSEKLEESVTKLKSFNMTTETAEKGLTKLINAGLTPEKAEELGNAALKIAQAKGQNIDDVYLKLSAAMMRGSAMMLKRGDNALFAKNDIDEQEINKKKASQRPGALADAVISASEKYANSGDFETASTKVANYENAIKNVHKDINDLLLPAMKDLYDYLGKGAKEMESWVDSIKGDSQAMEVLRQIMDLFLDTIKTLKDVGITILREVGATLSSIGLLFARTFSSDSEGLTGMQFLINVLKVLRLLVLGTGLSFQLAFQYIAGSVETAIAQIALLGTIAHDVFTLNWSKIGEDWSAGVKKVEEIAKASADRMRKTFDETKAKMETVANEAPKQQEKAQDHVNQNVKPVKDKQTSAEKAELKAQQRARDAAVMEGFKQEEAMQEEHLKAMDEKAKQMYKLGTFSVDEYTQYQKQSAINLYNLKNDLAEKEIQQLTAQRDRAEKLSERMVITNKINGIAAAQRLSYQRTVDEITKLDNQYATQKLADMEKVFNRQKDMDDAEVARAEAKLNARYANGGMTDDQKMMAENALIQIKLALIEKTVAQKQRDLDIGGLDLDQQAKLRLEIVKLNTEYTTLSQTIQFAGDKIKDSFQSSIETALNSFITGTTKIKDVLKSLVSDFATNLAKMEIKDLAKNATTALQQATGGRGNSIFDDIAGLMGVGKADGSEANPFYTKSKDSGDDLAGLLKNKNDGPLKEMASGVGSTLKGIFSQLGDGLHTFTDVLSNAFKNVGGGGGGGLGGLLGSIFGGGSGVNAPGGASFGADLGFDVLADGGLLNGRKHSAGGIMLEAEGGEYVINAKQTSRFLPLLHAINSGSLQMPSLPKFASGGLVGGGGGASMGGAQTNHINIAVDAQGKADAQGNGSAHAAEFAKQLSGMVVAEMVKQKRPGGLLAS